MWRLRIHTGIFSPSAPHSRIFTSTFHHLLLSILLHWLKGVNATGK
jgi:hypothetical protein